MFETPSSENEESHTTYMDLNQESIEMLMTQGEAMEKQLGLGEVNIGKFIDTLEEGELDTAE